MGFFGISELRLHWNRNGSSLIFQPKMHELSAIEVKAFIFLLFFVDDVRPSVVDTRGVSFSALDEGGWVSIPHSAQRDSSCWKTEGRSMMHVRTCITLPMLAFAPPTDRVSLYACAKNSYGISFMEPIYFLFLSAASFREKKEQKTFLFVHH